MNTCQVKIEPYKNADREDLLKLLVLLQINHYQKVTSTALQELYKEVNPVASYNRYLDLIDRDSEQVWKVFLARCEEGELAGFIIGSTSSDEDLVKPVKGKVEDWFVLDKYRSNGVGFKLYQSLEAWLKQKGCSIVESSTWPDNDISIEMHKKLGFIYTEVSFGKKL
jgi:GNAT superfamily N-acetyltransferase